MQRPPVTTTDALKLLGLVLVFIDHHGYFFDPANLWWRLPGRGAAPIFFFLVGFARTRSAPWSWLALGLALTLLNALQAPRLEDAMANILLNFALLRTLVLPGVERLALPSDAGAATLVLACLLLLRVSDGPLEYGTEGWLWAFAGLAHRLWREGGEERMRVRRDALAAVATVAYVLGEAVDFPFEPVQAVLLVPIVAGIAVLLLRFRREPLSPQPPAAAAPLFRLCGRYSLEIYAGGLFVSTALAYAIAA